MNKETKALIIKAIKKNLKELDDSGHAINKPSYYTDTLGLPSDYVKNFIKKHYSDKHNPKGMIFNDRGEVLAFSEGVYNLSILQHLAFTINPNRLYKKGQQSLGRGSEGRLYHQAITQGIKKF